MLTILKCKIGLVLASTSSIIFPMMENKVNLNYLPYRLVLMVSGVRLVTLAVACVQLAMSVLMVAPLYNLLTVLLAPMQHMGPGYAPIALWVSITSLTEWVK